MNGGDITRSTFEASRHFSGVRMQQGRVQLDADWNEQEDIRAHHDRAAVVDTVGPTGAPKAGGGFRLTGAADDSDLLLDPGRMWVGGTLCELEGDAAGAELTAAAAKVDSLVLDGRQLAVHDWVELGDAGGTTALARVDAVDTATRTLSLDPAPSGLTGPLRLRRRVSYANQPDLPQPALTKEEATGERTLDLPDGTYLAYLDVWQQTVTALEAPEIREPALGGPDTTTRSRTVWQVRLLPLVDPDPPAGLDCDSDLGPWTGRLAAPSGTMAARPDPEPEPSTANLCTPTPAGGFTGLENQLYRVQVRSVTNDGRPRILWSRDNGSVVTAWTGSNGDQLEVAGIGRDEVLGFGPDQWVELLDDTRELTATPGTLVQLRKAEGTTLFVVESTVDPAGGSIDHDDFGGGHPKVRRWDSDGVVTVDLDEWVELEDGVQVLFPSGGSFRPGDFWLVPARTAVADVDWPRDSTGRPLRRPPNGVEHAYARLALVHAAGGTLTVTDCRDRFPSLTTLTAGDVAVEDGVDTVQDALDELGKQRNLPLHHRLLHGWGIVCGLQVHCGDDAPRLEVKVQPGTAIETDGNYFDLEPATVPEPATPVPVATMAKDRNLLDVSGNGDISLFLDPTATPPFEIEKYDPKVEEPPDLLNGTLLLDFYNDCIKKLHDWLRHELTPPPGEEELPVGPARQRLAALINLITQPVNRKSGRNIFVSPREHKFLVDFYTELREQLQSETFCAMFDNARPTPDYPEALLGGGTESDPALDTIFGTGGHTRLRLRPIGTDDRQGEAYTVGAGVNPLKPTPFVNRYDLDAERMVARFDPISGEQITADTAPDPGTGPVTDVAFSPDGKRIYVVVPTRNEDNTIFRTGTLTDQGVDWQPMVTICGVKLVTLASTAADAAHVYAIGLRKETVTRPDGSKVVEWRGAGLYQINPDAPEPNPRPLVGPDQGFFPFGHLLLDDAGTVFATAVDGDVAVTAYTQVAQFQVPAGGRPAVWPLLEERGTDDIALVTAAQGRTFLHAVVDLRGGFDRAVVSFDLAAGPQSATLVPLDTGDSAVRLLDVGNGLLAVTIADQYRLKLLDSATGTLLPGLPMQVGPIAIAARQRGPVYVLNYVSNTLSVAARTLFDPQQPFDPENKLADYRKAMLEAYGDLLAGFLQYLKDCLFDHFLVRCPPEDLEQTIYLANVSIRDFRVYKVCNFSRRHYVKSFPTVGYWLSAVPVLRLLKQHFADLACMVLPEYFSRLSVKDDSEASNRVSVQQLEQLIAWSQSTDLPGRWREVRQRNTVAADAARIAIRSARPQPVSPGGRWIVSSEIVGQPIDRVSQTLAERGVIVRTEPFRPTIGVRAVGDLAALFREAEPGDEITLYEAEGNVRYFAVSKAPRVRPPVPEPPPAAPEAALAERVATLEQELAALRTQIGRRTTRTPRPKPKPPG
jgi:Family of unknown function (DUF6519)